ncbi:MAG TPA: AzlD domain-containing protein [Beutenbergiaceae bacterium]|nr:AzlD domain-containing protein [Beutenbergiaceae bacterium]
MSAPWLAVIVAAVGCYLLKLLGTSMPESALEHPVVQHTTQYLPIAMLAALVVTELVDGGGRYHLDWQVLVGVSVGVVALLLRFGFIVVFILAIAVTALLRLVT